MKLEVFSYYSNDPVIITPAGTELLGTIHLFISDIAVDIRGILCTRNKNGKLKVFLPSKEVIDEEGNKVRMPYFAFMDLSKNKELRVFCMNFLREKLKESSEKKG